jgi:SAM-dependent methyltransferase
MPSLIPTADEALAAWAARVRANREQVDRFREEADPSDFYAPLATMFRDDPRRTNEPALDVLRSLVRPGETWLDVGAGGGRYALPIALLADEVIALDQSDGMLEVLRTAMAEEGIPNVRIVKSRWPADEPPRADVALISHVGYDVEQIGPFLDAMETSARRLCVAVLFDRRPTHFFDELWPAVHGEPRETLPALRDFLVLLLARGRLFELRLADRPPMAYESPDQAHAFARRQTWVRPGSDKDRRVRTQVEAQLVERDGRYAFDWGASDVGIVTWRPDGAIG